MHVTIHDKRTQEVERIHAASPSHIPRTHFAEKIHGGAEIPSDRRRIYSNVVRNLKLAMESNSETKA